MIELGTELRWQDPICTIPMERVLLSEKVGYDAVFTAEGYGNEGIVPLSYIAARTERLKLGTRIMEVTGRPPVLAGMAYQTLNHVSGGNRVIAGLGSGSPQATEGFHGRKWGGAVPRMRDYVTILRQVFAGQDIDHQGSQWAAPYRGPGHMGIPAAPIGLQPMGDIPICIGASYPRMVELAAEIGDGWMPPGFAPGMMETYRPLLQRGFDKAGNGKGFDTFKIWSHVDVIVDDDVREAMRPYKEYVVTWSGMQRANMEARGYTELADQLADIMGNVTPADAEARVQQGLNLLPDPLWQQALDTVPDEYIDDGWLVGPVERIRKRVDPWLNCGLTGLIVRYGPQLGSAPVMENLDVFVAIAEAAGKEPVS
ncbi:LLM class flavin-dependent oxidoreductase [Amycolatopsis sp. GM8]|uniref:LLM class flavin-dependent oxidoreductase n=1 Tax=Amycolatopsis sp. GM8 TaxID=2896530 RepID=UPI001F1815BA|nr:LLM class flavin-dependent oxidoreductase [Amycolatopsis sp. GM8]